MIHATRGRIIEPEWLDEEPPEVAAHSLRDLVRINRLLGGHEVLRKTLRTVVRREEAFSLLDVGAASGDMGRIVAENYPRATVVSLDYKTHHLRAASGFRVAADAFSMPFCPGQFDFVFCSLFLHHFADERIVDLLREFCRLARRAVIVTDLERHPFAYYFLPATRWLFGWHPVTLHDGPISVEAAFSPEELKILAEKASLRDVVVNRYRPAFRLAMIGRT